MEVKDMREALKDVVEVVPRSNDAVVKLYNEKFYSDTIEEPIEVENPLSIVKNDNQYTYIGSGDTPPHVIKFMGIQVFTRGQLTTVTDPRVLEKVKVNSSFIKGEASPDLLYERDEEARKKAERQRDEDVQIQILVERENRKAG